MPGIASGSVEHRTLAGTAQTQNQEFFTNLFRFFNGPLRSGSYAQLVALSTGSSTFAAGPGGTNYHNETGSFGENAFFVFKIFSGAIPGAGPSTRRSGDYYVLFQWADTNNFGALAGSNPALLYGGTTGDGTGCAVAFRDDGLSPWNGTTNANGTDTKGNPVWISGSSKLHCLPRSNNALGAHQVARDNMVLVADAGASLVNYRYHFFADRDCFVTINDASDNINYNHIYFHGTYEPLPGFPTSSGGIMGEGSAHMPLLQYSDAGTVIFQNNVLFGITSGIESAPAGGVISPIMSQSVQFATGRGGKITRYGAEFFQNITFQPNSQFNPMRYDAMKIPLIVNESPNFGFIGHIDFINEIYNVGINNVTSGSDYASFGTSNGANLGILLPWSGSAPGTENTREGRFF